MGSKVEELYTKGGKELSELIQEWMDENNSSLYCENAKKMKNIIEDK